LRVGDNQGSGDGKIEFCSGQSVCLCNFLYVWQCTCASSSSS
jgi:hypothetical protein